MDNMETVSFNTTLDEYLENLEDLQDAIMVADDIRSGKEDTIFLEALEKDFSL